MPSPVKREPFHMCSILYPYIITCALYTIYNHILALQVIAASEETTKQVNSLQRQLKDLEDQKRSLQENLENVCMLFTLFYDWILETNQDVTFDMFKTLQIVTTTGLISS